MGAHINRIREFGSGSGGNSYVNYVLANIEEQSMAAKTTEIVAGSAESYSAYVATDQAMRQLGSPQTTRWFGAQAREWGLEGLPVNATDLTRVLSHHDPKTGADLDSKRVARQAKLPDRKAKWQSDRDRWAANPHLKEQANAFTAMQREIKVGAIRDPITVIDIIDKHLGTSLTDRQFTRLTTAATKAIAQGKDLNATLTKHRKQMRLVPPSKQPPRASEAPSSQIIGYDVGLSATGGAKFLLFDEGIRNRALAAKHRAVDRTLSLLEAELTAGRGGAGGRERHEAVGLAVAIITHFTGRPAGDPAVSDPDLHVHCVVGSLIQNLKTGEWSTIDSRTWMWARSILQGYYDGELRAELTAELGVAWRERETEDPFTGRKRTHWEMVITDDPVLDDMLIEAFSRRTTDIRAEVARLKAERKVARKDAVWDSTRNDKDELPLSQCEAEWHERIATLGLDPSVQAIDIAQGACNRATPESIAEAKWTIELGADSGDSIVAHLASLDPTDATQVAAEWTHWIHEEAETLAQKRATFGRQHLLLAAMRRASPTTSPSYIRAQVDTYLEYVARNIVEHVNEQDPTAWTQKRWTTDDQIDREWAALQTLSNLQQPAGAAVSAETARTVLENYRDGTGALTPEQELLFLSVLRDQEGGRLTASVAPAGSGKSYTARAVMDAWRLEHGDNKVFTLAPSSRAGVAQSNDLTKAAELQGALDRLIVGVESGRITLDAQTLVLIDEASMASLTKLHKVLSAIDEAGARVVLIGDPEQLDSPGTAGGLLHYLDSHGQTVNFDTTVRNRSPEIREAQLTWHRALAADDEKAAGATLDTWLNRGLVSVVDGELAAVDLAFEKWQTKHQANVQALAQWEADRQRLESAVQAAPNDSERQQAEDALTTHLASQPDPSILVLAERHEDIAVLSDRIQSHLIATGAIDARASVEGRRYRPADDGKELLVSASGDDLSHVSYCKGLQVRVTNNSRSGHIKDLLDAAISQSKEDYKGTKPWESRMAYSSETVRDLTSQLKNSQVLNGEVGTVEHVHGDGGLTVRVAGATKTAGDRLIRLNQEQLMDGLIVPCAGGTMTVHASQGQTVESDILIAGPQTSGDLLYVGVTRSRGDSEVIFAGDLSLKSPELVQWENNKRNAELEGEDYYVPPPVESIPGLWQLRKCWSRSDRSQLAMHEAEKHRSLVTDQDEAPQAFVTPGDTARALHLAELQGGLSAEAIAKLAQTAANTRVADEQRQAEEQRQRRRDIQQSEGLQR